MGKGLRQYKLKNKSIKLSDGKGVEVVDASLV